MNREAGILLGVPIDRKPLPTLTEESLQAIDGSVSQRIFACANPHSLVVAHGDPDFQRALVQAEFVVADGIGVSLMARLTGLQIGPRIAGLDYFFAVLNALQARGAGRVFFFGSSQRVLDLIAARFVKEFPSLTLCGVLSPPFGEWDETENSKMIRQINEARPDVLWVGMTAPKQEKWVERNRQALQVPIIGSIGAVFDFYAGTYQRAPYWVCRLGFEWAYRFMLEPRRMWRRNLVSAPKFIWLTLRHHLFTA